MHARLEPAKLKELCTKSFTPWVYDMLFDWALIVGSITLFSMYKNPLTFLLAVLIVGNRQHALAILGHDGTHYTLTKTRWLNDICTNIFNMWPVGLTVEGYRTLHFQHHRGLGTEEDPELHHKRSRAPQWDLPATPLKIFSYAVKDLFGYSIPDYYIIVTYAKPERIRLVNLVLFHVAAVAVMASMGLWWEMAIWYGCLPTSFMMFFRLRLWLEHQGTDRTTRLHLNWWQQFLLSPHKGWYHWEHHNWAGVPYYNLPKLRKLAGTQDVMTLSEFFSYIGSVPATASGVIFSHNPTPPAYIPADDTLEERRAA